MPLDPSVEHLRELASAPLEVVLALVDPDVGQALDRRKGPAVAAGKVRLEVVLGHPGRIGVVHALVVGGDGHREVPAPIVLEAQRFPGERARAVGRDDDRRAPALVVRAGTHDPTALEIELAHAHALAKLGAGSLEEAPQQIVEMQPRHDVAGLVPEAATDAAPVREDGGGRIHHGVRNGLDRVAGAAELVHEAGPAIGDRVPAGLVPGKVGPVEHQHPGSRTGRGDARGAARRAGTDHEHIDRRLAHSGSITLSRARLQQCALRERVGMLMP